MAFNQTTVAKKEEEKTMANIKPNSNADLQLDNYMVFGAESISEIDAENIPYINERLESINFKNEIEGDPIIEPIPMSEYFKKTKAKSDSSKPKKNNKSKEKKRDEKPKMNKIAEGMGLTEIEPLYAKHMYSCDNFASIARDEECFMHQWTGNYWKRASKLDGQQMALDWLEKNYPDKATAKNAYGCFDTAKIGLLNKRKFPLRSKNEIYIPLIDAWLMLTPAGKIYIMEPSKHIGITHQINASLGKLTKRIVDDFGNVVVVDQAFMLAQDDFGTPVFVEYTPKLMPEDSMWKKFLDDSQPDMKNQDILQEYTGYTLLPDTRYQKAIVNVGNGSNGKGVYTEVVSHLHENVISVNMDKLSNFGLSQLPDASLAVVAETPKKNINEEMLKQCISGDKIVIEIKRMSQFTLKPFAKWIISCNAFPRIQDETDGVWRRFIIIPWEKQFLEQNKVLNLDQKIIEKEMGVVLDWALAGLQRLLSRGENGDFVIPEHLKLVKMKEKEKSNNVIPFIDNTYLVKTTDAVTKKDDIFKRYQAYCLDKGILPFGNSEFWKRVSLYFKDGLIEKKKTDCGERKYFVNLMFSPVMEGEEDECDNPFEAEPQAA